MPAVTPPSFDLLASATLLTASFMAAATRSSAISGSSANSLRSMVTRRTSWAPLIPTVTRPPPALPVTSSLAISSCARFMSSCMRCACCISWPICPLMIFSGDFSFIGGERLRLERLDRLRDDLGAELTLQGLHQRIVVDGFFGGRLRFFARVGRACRRRMRGNTLVVDEAQSNALAQRIADAFLHLADHRFHGQMHMRRLQAHHQRMTIALAQMRVLRQLTQR